MICKKCKHNTGVYCKVFKCKIATLPYYKTTCTHFGKKLDKPIRNTIKKDSLKQEKRLAQKLNQKYVKLTPASGSTPVTKGDLEIKGKYVLESKATKTKRLTITLNWLEQLNQYGKKFGKIPILALEFKKQNQRFYILAEDDFIELTF